MPLLSHCGAIWMLNMPLPLTISPLRTRHRGLFLAKQAALTLPTECGYDRTLKLDNWSTQLMIWRGSIFICCTLSIVAMIGNDRAEGGTIQPIAIAGPNIASDVLLVASKKKRSTNSGGRVSHLEALAICRKKYGWSNVARVTFRKDGSFICHRPVVRR